MDKMIKIGVIGLGGRGMSTLSLLLSMEDVEVPSVCEKYTDRLEAAAALVHEKRGTAPRTYSEYKQMLDAGGLDGVIIASSWQTHAKIAVYAMEHGIYAAPEVGGACSTEDCWSIVRAYEKTGVPCMMLENCCYGREEMAILNMVKQGIFGEIVHCQGGYQHDLRDEVALGAENRHYRLDNYMKRNGELYPTHELGPIANILNINRGNRFLTLSSIASKSRGLRQWIKTRREDLKHPSAEYSFAQGDVVTTMIKCSGGETILLIHDTTLPRPYSRGLRVQGTGGIYMEDKNALSLDSVNPHSWQNFNEYMDRYEHPLWSEYRMSGVKAGHGGMDYLVLRAFAESVASGCEPPIDAYDTAAWMAVTCLSEDSVALGGMPVPFPDFTGGRWLTERESRPSKYALDAVYPEAFGCAAGGASKA